MVRVSLLTGLIVALLFCSQTFAQIQVGPRLGANFTTTIDAGPADKPLKPGLNGGGAAMFKLSYNFFVQPGLIYSQKGVKIENGIIDQSVTYSYLEARAPFYYQLPFFNTDKYDVQVGAGAYFGFLLSDGDANLDKSFDAGPTVSAEFLVNEVGPGTIVLQPALDYGLVNLRSPDANDSARNIAYTFSAMYLFNLDSF